MMVPHNLTEQLLIAQDMFTMAENIAQYDIEQSLAILPQHVGSFAVEYAERSEDYFLLEGAEGAPLPEDWRFMSDTQNNILGLLQYEAAANEHSQRLASGLFLGSTISRNFITLTTITTNNIATPHDTTTKLVHSNVLNPADLADARDRLSYWHDDTRPRLRLVHSVTD